MAQIMLQYFHKQEKSSRIKSKRGSFFSSSIKQGESSQSSLTPTTRSTVDLKIDWGKCMFCEQMTYKKEKGTIRVATFKFGQKLDKTINGKNDTVLRARLGHISKLIANEARYHKNCHAKYVSMRKPSLQQSVHDIAVKNFLEVIEKDLIDGGRAFDMKTLLSILKEKIIELDCENVSEDSYSIEKLKKKLAGHFGNSIAFHKPSDVLMPEIVFSSSIETKDIINLASSYKERIRLRNISEDLSGNLLDASNISEESTVHYASVIIRKHWSSWRAFSIDLSIHVIFH